MGKVRITQKAAKSRFTTLFYTGYGTLQNLLKYRKATYYTAGIYGWNADIYPIGTMGLCTGYRSFGHQKLPSSFCRVWEAKASDILDNRDLTYQEREAEMEKLLESFLQALKEL